MIMMMRISWGHWWWIIIWQWWWDHPCNPPLRWRRSRNRDRDEQDVLTKYFCVLYVLFVRLFMIIFSDNKVCIYFHQCNTKKLADQKKQSVNNFHYHIFRVLKCTSNFINDIGPGVSCMSIFPWSILETGSPSLSYIGKAQSSLKCPNQIAAQPAF